MLILLISLNFVSPASLSVTPTSMQSPSVTFAAMALPPAGFGIVVIYLILVLVVLNRKMCNQRRSRRKTKISNKKMYSAPKSELADCATLPASSASSPATCFTRVLANDCFDTVVIRFVCNRLVCAVCDTNTYCTAPSVP